MSHDTPQFVRRLGVIGDVHTEADALERALSHLTALEVDRIAATGDIVDGPCGGAAVDRCCELLREHAAITVCGNHDRWLQEGEMRDLPDAVSDFEISDDARTYLDTLPPTVDFKTPAGDVLLCHGLGEDDMAKVEPSDRGQALTNNTMLQALLHPRRYEVVINGHSHLRMVRTIGELTLINAGTLLRTAEPGFVTVDFEDKRVQFFNLDKDGSVTKSDRFSFPQAC